MSTKAIRILLAVCCFCVVVPTAKGENEVMFDSLSVVPRRAMYVVEVFTSQGCNSCPPADEAVSILYAEAQERGLDLHVLAWHVDYWDYLGWRDPYGSAVSTRRQRDYAQRMRRRTVYTPQVLVNGHAEPSNPYRADSITAALQTAGRSQHTDIKLNARAHALNDRRVEVAYTQPRPAASTSFLGSGYEIGVLVVESGITTQPTRGENRGRQLENNHVVRASAFERLRNSGIVTLDLPSDLRRSKSNVVVIVQDRQTRHIVFVQAVSW